MATDAGRSPVVVLLWPVAHAPIWTMTGLSISCRLRSKLCRIVARPGEENVNAPTNVGPTNGLTAIRTAATMIRSAAPGLSGGEAHAEGAHQSALTKRYSVCR